MGFKQSAKQAALATGLFPAIRSLKRKVCRAESEVEIDAQLYSRFIAPGDLVFDVGVNLAQKALAFAKCGARVIAVEPNQLCFPTIRREMKGKDYVLVPKALAAQPGQMILNVVGTESTASLRTDWQPLKEHGNCRQMPVEVTTLDALIEEYGVPDFCKIDVEGFELEVLEGLTRPLKMVTFEYHASERGRMMACLRKLECLSPIKINFISINGDHFELAEWLTLGEFLDCGVDLPRVGDCFVSSVANYLR
jgi:FkbM family methyltransferase